MRNKTPLLLFTAISLGCPTPDDTGIEPAWTAVTLDDVRAVVDADCSADSLPPLQGAEPAAVRALLVELDAELKLTE